MSKTLLFVYGTLKTGQSNEKMLDGQEFVGPARTLPIYRLYGLGWHPGLVVDQANGLSVSGELWAVDSVTLARLDDYEGVPHWFNREYIALADRVGDFQAYFYKQSVPDDAPSGAEWPFPF
jgi:gamma-glutamylaminecyclotransferase